jgi:hypothetical protein
MPRHGAPSSTISIALIIVATSDTRPTRRSNQAEPEQHNGSWHDRLSQLVAPSDPFARPAVDRSGKSAAIVDHRLDTSRFIPGNLCDKIHVEFPSVWFVDHIGGDGRLKAEFNPNAIPFSVPSRNAL